MFFRSLSLVLISSAVIGYGQTTGKRPISPPSVRVAAGAAADDELTRHLSAAQTYQLAGDLDRAAVENKAVIAIALQRIGIAELEHQKYTDAAQHLLASAAMKDSSLTRAGLAAAYLQMSRRDEALVEARNAVRLDPINFRASQILGSIHYAAGNYEAAVPELEKVFRLAPNFDSAYLLGITYLHLKQLERAKLLFDEIQLTVKTRKADLHILFGQAFEQTGYAAEAEREFKAAIAVDSRVAKAHFYLGFVILQHGGSERLSEAGKEFDAELKLTPLDFHANFFRGVVASSLNDHKQAILYLQRSIGTNPKSSEAYLFLGQSQLELNDLPAAEKSLRLSLKLSDRSTKHQYQDRRTHFLLGRLLLRTGRKAEGDSELAKAREIQDRLLESDRQAVGKLLGQVAGTDTRDGLPKQNEANGAAPLSPESRSRTAAKTAEFTRAKNLLAAIVAEAYHNLGVIHTQKNELQSGIDNFTAAAKWKPDLPGLDRNWGIVSFRAEQFDKAIAPLLRHIKANPKDDLVRRMLGSIYFFTKDFKQAVATLKPIELGISKDAELTYFYGVSLIQLHLKKEAAAVFSRLSEQNIGNTGARYQAAQGFVFVGDYERAVKEYRAVAELDPQMKNVHYNTGQTLIRMNRLEDAEKEFRKELQVDPTDAASKYHLAYTMLERNIQTDEVVSLLNDAIRYRPDYADAHYQLGKIYIGKGQNDTAIDHLETAVRYEPKKDYIHYQLSIAYRRASRIADAERELKIFRDLKASNRQVSAPSGIKENVPQ